ncbi:hypothetical protein PUN28_014776 [Cardiocondyla obscurior]|uniref:Uncharacterized protein n=1 Tax=Cardiocondyla obscurior TaxID=286306 RepID=A0AAW2EZ52_9HYME
MTLAGEMLAPKRFGASVLHCVPSVYDNRAGFYESYLARRDIAGYRREVGSYLWWSNLMWILRALLLATISESPYVHFSPYARTNRFTKRKKYFIITLI